MEHRQRETPRLVLGRVVLAVAVSALALAVAGLAGAQVLESLKQWLHRQKQYETTFSAIALDPPPPPWYRGATGVFLQRVRESAQRPDAPFSALDVDLAELDRDFRLYCWVKRVRKVERKTPNRIIVQLDYRIPVARALLPEKPVRVLVDADGVILPWEDVDEEMTVKLPLISGTDPPLEPRPGRCWLASDGKADERLLAAARLAAFLAFAQTSRPLEVLSQVKVIHSLPNDGLFVESAQSTLIYWVDAPGVERPGSLTAEQKWDMLRRWLPQRPKAPILRPYYLAFRKEGVVIAKDNK
jgi:hypothetical protein